jgi:uncharacterized membrane protein YfcA
MIISIIITGFLVGLLVGLTGMGGALLMTPLLILLYGFSPTMAVGTDLVYAATTKAVGSLQHIKQKTVDWNTVKKLAQGSLPGGIVGVLLIRLLHQVSPFPVEEVLGQILGITFIAVSIWMLVQMIHWRGKRPQRLRLKFPIQFFGFVGGLLVGLTSVGSGSLFMAVLLSSTALSAAVLVGTDVVHAFFLTLMTGIMHATFGHVDWGFVSWLLVGSIPGILLGGRLTLRIPEIALRIAIVIVLFCTGFKMV